jgi:hypothetical protein
MDDSRKKKLDMNKKNHVDLNSLEEDIILNGDSGVNPFKERKKRKKKNI